MTAGDWKVRLQQWMSDETLDLVLPELAALRGVQQPAAHHPEGDAYVHTLLAVAAVDDQDDERVVLAVLLHDIGKAVTTVFSDGQWRAHGHCEAGAAMVRQALGRLGRAGLADDVEWLVRHHQYRLSWNLQPGQELSPRQSSFTRHELFPLLLQVCAADRAGRVPMIDLGHSNNPTNNPPVTA